MTRPIRYGCEAMALAAFAFTAYAIVTVSAARIGLLAIALVILLAWLFKRLQLQQAIQSFRRRHGASGRDLLIVYSASPHWQDYIDSQWVAKWGDRAVVLNRSSPDWQQQAEATLWQRLAGRVEHTPVVIVIPRRGRPQVIRFYNAFNDYKHGKAATLRARERDLEQAIFASESTNER